MNGISKHVPKPRQYQQRAFEFIKNLDQFALFMVQGSGKSKVSIMKIWHLVQLKKIDRVLIVCPDSIKRQWVEEQFKDHYPGQYGYYIWSPKIHTTKYRQKNFKNFCDNPKLKVLSANIETFRSPKSLKWLKYFLKLSTQIIVDESVIIKNPKAKQTKALLKLFEQFQYKGILTGTPSPNGPFDLFSQFEFLKPNFFGMKFYNFKHRFGIIFKQTITKDQEVREFDSLLSEDTFLQIKSTLIETQKTSKLNLSIIESVANQYKTSVTNILTVLKMSKFLPYKNLDELNKQIETITFKLQKSDMDELPEKVYQTLEVDLSLEQNRLYTELLQKMSTQYESQELSVVNKITLLLRLQQITGGHFPFSEVVEKEIDNILYKFENFTTKQLLINPKLNILEQDLSTVDPKTSVIIWAVFRAELESIYERLRKYYNCKLVTGKTNNHDRDVFIESFKNKQTQILIMSPGVGGMGLNLQVSNLHYFYSNDYRADRRLQAEDRSHRIGQKNNVVYKDLICRGSIDQRITKMLQSKISIIDFFRNNSIKNLME